MMALICTFTFLELMPCQKAFSKSYTSINDVTSNTFGFVRENQCFVEPRLSLSLDNPEFI